MDDKNNIFPLARLLTQKRKDYEDLNRRIIKREIIPQVILYGKQIIGGIDEYEICEANGITYQAIHLDFPSPMHASEWICTEQLKRKNITDTMYRFLLGYLVISVSAVKSGWNKTNFYNIPVRNEAASEVAELYGISFPTVQNYKNLTLSLLKVHNYNPELVEYILNEHILMSLSNILFLFRRPRSEYIQIVNEARRSDKQIRFLDICKKLGWHSRPIKPKHRISGDKVPEIRKMPQFDPDAELASLSLTAESWSDTILRMDKPELAFSSRKAKKQLKQSLRQLINSAQSLIKLMEV